MKNYHFESHFEKKSYDTFDNQPILTFCFKDVLPYFSSRCQEALPTYAAHKRAQAAPAFNVRYQTSGENVMP